MSASRQRWRARSSDGVRGRSRRAVTCVHSAVRKVGFGLDGKLRSRLRS